MAKRTGAPIVPVLFDAANSWLFQSVGQLRGMIRTALLPRELLWKRNKTVKVRIGAKIDAERLKRFENAEDASEFVRACVPAGRLAGQSGCDQSAGRDCPGGRCGGIAA